MTTQSDFVVWEHDPVDDAAALLQLENVDDDWELVDGVSRAQGWPDDAKYPMDPETRDSTLLTDSMFNTDSLLVVSPKLKDFLESQKVAVVEYLPVTIFNHKKKPVKPGYFIVSPLDPVDCIDAKKSRAKYSKVDPTEIMDLSRLVIDETKVPADRSMIRVKSYTGAVIVRRKLADAISKQAFTGIRFLELDEYPED